MSQTQPVSWWKAWRRRLKDRLPYVRRREIEKLRLRHEELLGLFTGAGIASRAAVKVLKAPGHDLDPEICLFVSYAPQPALKRHVHRHIAALQANGVGVLLIVNSPLPAEEFAFDTSFVEGLRGLIVRENSGFDFGGWAHAHVMYEKQLSGCSRLLLVNDSIVGPNAHDSLAQVLERIRTSQADVVGLTDNRFPRHHLQSYFLAAQRRALQSDALPAFMARIANLPTKELVILAYEAYFTARMKSAGCTTETLYPSPSGPMNSIRTWADLARQGMPYLKTDVLEAYWDTHDLKQLVPGEILSAYEFANRT